MAVKFKQDQDVLFVTGNNDYGALGNNSTISKSSFIQISGTGWRYVGIGAAGSTLAIKTDGTLWGWGLNAGGQLGDNTNVSKSSPIQISMDQYKKVTLLQYTNSAFALKKDNTLWASGDNQYGQLGLGNTNNVWTFTQVSGSWTDVARGSWGAAGIKTDGTLWTWGRGMFGDLGHYGGAWGDPPLQTLCGGNDWKKVAGRIHGFAGIKTNGTLWTWGFNRYGGVGDGTTIDKSSPVQIPGTNWKQITGCGEAHVAIKTDGTLWRWGVNDISGTMLSSPEQVGSGSNWKRLTDTGSGNAIMVTKTDNTIWGWGYNQYGELGANNVSWYTSPIQIVGSEYKTAYTGNYGSALIKKVSAQDLDELYVRKDLFTEGNAFTWGRNDSGQLGDNTAVVKSSPVQVAGSTTTWKQLSCGYHSAGIKTDGTLWMWGKNTDGQLGKDNTASVSSPQQTVSATTDWKYVGTSTYHSSMLKTDGTIWSCGYNLNRELGDGTVIKRSSPVQLSVGGTYKSLSVGSSHGMAIKTDGTLWGWGYNQSYGALGDGTTVNRDPTNVITGTWKQVSCGWYHNSAIKEDGTLWSWGDNNGGQIGNGTAGNKYSSPMQVAGGGTNWKYCSAGNTTTAAIKTDGTLWTWGSNLNGQLGINSSVGGVSSPVKVAGSYWRTVNCGIAGAIFGIKTDSTLWAWGNASSGQLGDGFNENRSSPTQIGNEAKWKQVHSGYTTSGAVKISE